MVVSLNGCMIVPSLYIAVSCRTSVSTPHAAAGTLTTLYCHAGALRITARRVQASAAALDTMATKHRRHATTPASVT